MNTCCKIFDHRLDNDANVNSNKQQQSQRDNTAHCTMHHAVKCAAYFAQKNKLLHSYDEQNQNHKLIFQCIYLAFMSILDKLYLVQIFKKNPRLEKL